MIVASPGFVKNEFFKFFKEKFDQLPRLKKFKNNQEKFMLVHSSTGYTNCLSEILTDK